MATVDTAPGSHATGMGGGGDGDDPTRRHRDDRPQGHRSDRSRNVLTPKKKEDVESLRKLVPGWSGLSKNEFSSHLSKEGQQTFEDSPPRNNFTFRPGKSGPYSRPRDLADTTAGRLCTGVLIQHTGEVQDVACGGCHANEGIMAECIRRTRAPRLNNGACGCCVERGAASSCEYNSRTGVFLPDAVGQYVPTSLPGRERRSRFIVRWNRHLGSKDKPIIDHSSQAPVTPTKREGGSRAPNTPAAVEYSGGRSRAADSSSPITPTGRPLSTIIDGIHYEAGRYPDDRSLRNALEEAARAIRSGAFRRRLDRMAVREESSTESLRDRLRNTSVGERRDRDRSRSPARRGQDKDKDKGKGRKR